MLESTDSISCPRIKYHFSRTSLSCVSSNVKGRTYLKGDQASG